MYSFIEIFFEALDLVLVLFQGYFLQYFLGNFLESRGKSRYTGLYVTLIYTVMRKYLDFLWPPIYEGGWMFGKQVLSLLLTTILILCFYKSFRSITIFLVASFQAIRDISVYFIVILLDKPSDLTFVLWEWCGEKGILPSISVWNKAANLSMGGFQLLRVLLILLLMGFSLKKIVNDFPEKDLRIQRAELMFILIPALTSLMLCTLLRVIMVTVEEDIPIFLYKKYPPLGFLLPGVLFLALLAILQGVKSFREMVNLNREKNSRLTLEKQVEDMQAYMMELERIYSGVRSIKHDMKNSLAIIGQLAEHKIQSENRELQTYLSALNETMEQLEIPFRTGNQVVDALLHRKNQEAQELLPDLMLDTEQLVFPKTLSVRSYDLGILLGNAFDNALEACCKLKKQKPEAEVFIRLIAFQKGMFLFFRVENSFDGVILQKSGVEFPITDKKDKEMHGIGLLNIKKVVESYEGTVDWKITGPVFTLAIMLKNQEKEGRER